MQPPEKQPTITEIIEMQKVIARLNGTTEPDEADEREALGMYPDEELHTLRQTTLREAVKAQRDHESALLLAATEAIGAVLQANNINSGRSSRLYSLCPEYSPFACSVIIMPLPKAFENEHGATENMAVSLSREMYSGMQALTKSASDISVRERKDPLSLCVRGPDAKSVAAFLQTYANNKQKEGANSPAQRSYIYDGTVTPICGALKQ